jgi:hypothetical protein
MKRLIGIICAILLALTLSSGGSALAAELKASITTEASVVGDGSLEVGSSAHASGNPGLYVERHVYLEQIGPGSQSASVSGTETSTLGDTEVSIDAKKVSGWVQVTGNGTAEAGAIVAATAGTYNGDFPPSDVLEGMVPNMPSINVTDAEGIAAIVAAGTKVESDAGGRARACAYVRGEADATKGNNKAHASAPASAWSYSRNKGYAESFAGSAAVSGMATLSVDDPEGDLDLEGDGSIVASEARAQGEDGGFYGCAQSSVTGKASSSFDTGGPDSILGAEAKGTARTSASARGKGDAQSVALVGSANAAGSLIVTIEGVPFPIIQIDDFDVNASVVGSYSGGSKGYSSTSGYVNGSARTTSDEDVISMANARVNTRVTVRRSGEDGYAETMAGAASVKAKTGPIFLPMLAADSTDLEASLLASYAEGKGNTPGFYATTYSNVSGTTQAGSTTRASGRAMTRDTIRGEAELTESLAGAGSINLSVEHFVVPYDGGVLAVDHGTVDYSAVGTYSNGEVAGGRLYTYEYVNATTESRSDILDLSGNEGFSSARANAYTRMTVLENNAEAATMVIAGSEDALIRIPPGPDDYEHLRAFTGAGTYVEASDDSRAYPYARISSGSASASVSNDTPAILASADISRVTSYSSLYPNRNRGFSRTFVAGGSTGDTVGLGTVTEINTGTPPGAPNQAYSYSWFAGATPPTSAQPPAWVSLP